MIEAIQAAAAGAAQAQAAAPAVSQQPQAHAYNIQQFAEAYERAGAQQAALADAARSTSVVSAPQIDAGRGFAIALDKLNGSAEGINALSQTMTAKGEDLTPGEMMQMTMRCHQFLFTSELTSNVANRTSDGIQQLFRQQS